MTYIAPIYLLAILLQLKRRNYHPVHLLSIAPESPADSFNSSLAPDEIALSPAKGDVPKLESTSRSGRSSSAPVVYGVRAPPDPPLAHLRRADRRRGRRHEPLPCSIDADGVGVATAATCTRRLRWRRRWITAEDELLSPQAVHHGSRVQHRHEANKGGHRQEPQPASGARHVAAAAAPQSETCNFC